LVLLNDSGADNPLGIRIIQKSYADLQFETRNGILFHYTLVNENNTDQNLVENPEGQQVMYYKIPVEYEIQGNFLSYLKFRRALSKSQKVINFDKEEINVQKEIQGQILSKGTISIVGLPNEYN